MEDGLRALRLRVVVVEGQRLAGGQLVVVAPADGERALERRVAPDLRGRRRGRRLRGPELLEAVGQRRDLEGRRREVLRVRVVAGRRRAVAGRRRAVAGRRRAVAGRRRGAAAGAALEAPRVVVRHRRLRRRRRRRRTAPLLLRRRAPRDGRALERLLVGRLVRESYPVDVVVGADDGDLLEGLLVPGLLGLRDGQAVPPAERARLVEFDLRAPLRAPLRARRAAGLVADHRDLHGRRLLREPAVERRQRQGHAVHVDHRRTMIRRRRRRGLPHSVLALLRQPHSVQRFFTFNHGFNDTHGSVLTRCSAYDRVRSQPL